MEAQQVQQANEQEGGGGKSSNSFMCRQSSTRWTPTTDQIRILKDLYYNNGVRSPTAEQIQRISAKLRQYGKIEGKNVFYWFQNHKARERQKKRFTSDHHHHQIPPVMMHTRPSPAGNNNTANCWKNDHHQLQDHHHHLISPVYNKFSSSNTATPPPYGNFPSSSTCSPGLLTANNVGNYGSVAMEKSFRECSINPSGSSVNGGSMGQNFAWIGVDPYPYPYPHPFLEKRKYDEALEMEEEEDQQQGLIIQEANPEIETLPLFPVHRDKHDFNGWRRRAEDVDASAAAVAGPMASLELTLNSYAACSSRFE